MRPKGVRVIEAVGLTKRYEGHLALDDLNLRVGPGELLALFGGNGAGKSTTINLFLGFIEPSSGEARLGGTVVHQKPNEARSKLAYVAENVMLYGHFSARENLRYFTELAGLRVGDREADAMLVKAGLPPEACGREVRFFSKGMRQKTGLAIAFAKKAPAIFLDEPFSGLDPSAAAELMATVRAAKQEGTAILMSTHDLFRARELADELGIMRKGKLVRRLAAAEAAHVDLQALYLETMAEAG